MVNVGEQSKGEIRKDRKTILSEERLKKEKKKERKEKKERPVDVWKIKRGESLREVIVKIGQERIDTGLQ